MESELTKYTESLPASIKELKDFKEVARRRYAAQVQAIKAMESLDGAEAYVKKASRDAGEWEIKAWLAEARIGELLGPGEEEKGGRGKPSKTLEGYDHNDRHFARKFFGALRDGSLGKHIEKVESQGPVAYRLPLSTAHVDHNSGNNEWYTPPEIVDSVRSVLGEIDLDPASSEKANEVVGAKKIFTESDDSLNEDWKGRVYMNPPYASELIKDFVSKFCDEVINGNVTEGIVLVNNATETAWFAMLASVSDAVCFPLSRVKFWSPERESATPLQGQAILYTGEKKKGFIEAFKEMGWVCQISR